MTTLPTDWTSDLLSKVVRCQGGSAFSPTLQGRSVGDIPFFKVSDMNLPGNQWIMRRANNYVDLGDKDKISGSDKPAGAVVFPKVGAAIHTNKKRMLASAAFVDNNVMAVWSMDTAICRPSFLYLYFLTVNLSDLSNPGPLPSINNNKIYERTIVLPPAAEQDRIAAVLWDVRRAIDLEDKIIASMAELKRAALARLFTGGLLDEPRHQTELGPLPESWAPTRLEDCCEVVSSSLSYTDFMELSEAPVEHSIQAMGIKVSDMNLAGNEQEIIVSNLHKRIPVSIAERRLVPPGTVVFPKRGAAIATNKKRMTTSWTVLDPNLIGVAAGATVDPWFLYQWFQQFDLRTITEPGPTPQLNKKNVTPLLLPVPSSLEEQRGVANLLRLIDERVKCAERRRQVLGELFAAMLDKLMTGEMRVDTLEIDISGLEAA